jgi:hypothetical protein
MNPKQSGRRRFLKESMALAGLAARAIAIRSASGQALGSANDEALTGTPGISEGQHFNAICAHTV